MNILYKDEHILMVEKPVGLLSQENAEGRDSLPLRLAQSDMPVLPVHRLDRETGGVMVYARTKKAAATLSSIVGDHEVFVKEYLAVVCGVPEISEGTLEDLLYHDVRKNKSFVVKRERKGVRLARLSYTVLATIAKDNIAYTLIRVRLHTGRTHQIRVQFASRGLPLAGDTRYGGVRGCDMGLWSHRLSLPHPISSQVVTAVSNPPISTAPWCYFSNI